MDLGRKKSPYEIDLYLHPKTLAGKFSKDKYGLRANGLQATEQELLKAGFRPHYSRKPIEIVPGVFFLGEIPRLTDFEKVHDRFVDQNGFHDTMPDDTALMIDRPEGAVVLLGCSHCGAVNTVRYALQNSVSKKISWIIGGCHLYEAGEEQIEKTIEAFRFFQGANISLNHCTGEEARKKIKSIFKSRYVELPENSEIEV